MGDRWSADRVAAQRARFEAGKRRGDAEQLLADGQAIVAAGHFTMADLIAESVGEMTWSEVWNELRRRRLPVPPTTEAMRSDLIAVYIRERNTALATQPER